MGNLCCGKADDNFTSPGRVLGSAPPQPQRAAVPASQKVRGPGRTLGGSGAGKDTSSSSSPPQEPGGGGSAADDARKRAAEAAEARAKAAQKTTGKLGTQLQAQKKQTRQDTLKEASENEVRAREAEQAAQARNFD
ncbi:hypothetical protein BX600DRAFT_508036 [Xylariales sp. PMI_506]|nr:hypothetical protein BX600DRAFT_508036 [Xylariales sp. PMI_506]